MKNSILYIVGAVALLGGGVFLFLRNKKSKDVSKLADLENLTTNVGVVSPLKITEEVKKDNSKNIADAINLATDIADLKAKKVKYSTMSDNEFARTDEASNGFWANNPSVLKQVRESTLNTFSTKIKALNEKIVALGYMEVNGSISKI
jgi:LPXTG-motif cell wall-anchored protein